MIRLRGLRLYGHWPGTLPSRLPRRTRSCRRCGVPVQLEREDGKIKNEGQPDAQHAC
jgi:hypothetical protein